MKQLYQRTLQPLPVKQPVNPRGIRRLALRQLIKDLRSEGTKVRGAGLIALRYVLDRHTVTVREQVLLARNSKGAYGFPKGVQMTCDPEDPLSWETVYQYLARELDEETTIDIIITKS